MKLKVNNIVIRVRELERWTKRYNLDVTKPGTIHDMVDLVDLGFQVCGHGTNLSTGKQDFTLRYPSTSYKGESYIAVSLNDKKVTHIDYLLSSEDNLSYLDMHKFYSVLEEVRDIYGK